MLETDFFDKPADELAIALLGTFIRRQVVRRNGERCWLTAKIIETEAYFRAEKASHSSLGITEARRAMFMSAGTIYMYYARGGDSLNFSAKGDGDAVLIKSAIPVFTSDTNGIELIEMQRRNPGTKGPRTVENLCRGQTLLCRALDLKVPEWNAQQMDINTFYLERGIHPENIVVTKRLGIPAHRDPHLMLRYIDLSHCRSSTKNPITIRGAREGVDYFVRTPDAAMTEPGIY